MNDWHKFLATYYKEKKAIDPNYLYRQAMRDGQIPYAKFKKEQKKIRKEIGKHLHIIRDPLNYIMSEYLNTHDKISLKLSSDFFTNVKLNNKDCKLLYSENKKRIKDEKNKKFRLPKARRLTSARLRQLLMGM